ncbi:MAG: hypothetical protein ACOCV9_05330 [Marinilabiliaceae bacterium]
MTRTIIILLLLLLSWSGSAQQTERKNLIITAVPQHILNNAIRFEIDVPMSNQSRWLTVAPQFFYRAEDMDGAFDHPDYNKLIGAEIDMLSRKYLLSETDGTGFYYSYGGGYRFLKINTSNHLWQKSPDEELDWYRLNYAQYNINIHGINAKFLTGYQMTLYDNMVADAYIGFGLRYSFLDAPEGNFLKFNRNVNDYAYRGMLLVGGLRIGLGW